MKKSSIFIVGVVCGASLCFFAMRATSPQVISKAQKQVESPVEKIDSEMESEPVSARNSAASELQQKSARPQQMTSALSIPQSQDQVQTEGIQEPVAAPRKFSISLSETEVSAIERQWADLPYQAVALREARGWRIKTLREDSLLAAAGLQEGYLITRVALEDYAQTEGDERLAQRVASILDHISR